MISLPGGSPRVRIFPRQPIWVTAIGLTASLQAYGCTDDEGLERSRNEFVVDQAALIEPESGDRMDALLGAMLDDLDIEVVAATVPTLDGASITSLTGSLFETWAVGALTRANRGLLLVIAAEEEQARLQVSYELEAIFTDAFVSYVEREQMAAYFEQGRIGEGVEATVELIARRAYEGVRGMAYDPTAPGSDGVSGYRSGGGGAQAPIHLRGGSPPDPARVEAPARARYGAQPTPDAAWRTFLEVNRRRIKDPDLGIYGPNARDLLRRGTSNASQDHIARLYAGTTPSVRTRADRAAIVFTDDPDHLLAPWFFRQGPGGWHLDGSMYPDVIGYNHLNQWRFRKRDHPYAFAFRDYRFDRNGFAFYRG